MNEWPIDGDKLTQLYADRCRERGYKECRICGALTKPSQWLKRKVCEDCAQRERNSRGFNLIVEEDNAQ